MSLRNKFVLTVVFLLTGALLLWAFWPYHLVGGHPKVLKIAPNEANYLLEIDKHIRFSPRPEETYSFPIPLGEVGPAKSLYSGPLQYPFYCMSLASHIGQPEVDNQEGYGVPVYKNWKDESGLLGYSKDCGVKSHLKYFYYNGHRFIPTTEQEIVKLDDDKPLFRIEQGTINRFIYTIAMPIAKHEVGQRLAKSKWNQRLIYQFIGGSGIGFRQGKLKGNRALRKLPQQVLDGYAVISSSGNRTSYTYNMLLAEDTARRVKRQFVSLYGEPLYTVGIGGSGGGLAQYLIGQNSTGILDGLIPMYSYPDMITQTTYALDCDLLNNYFTFRAKNRRSWDDWRRRQLIEGMNAINDFPQPAAYLQPVNQLMAGLAPSFPTGNSECINGYYGLSAFINNPKQGFLRNLFDKAVVKATNWSYWQDMANLLGTDELGYGLSTWDNVGVQYGLTALQQGYISMEEFLDLNAQIGSWKPQSKMKKETILMPLGAKNPIWLTLWGNQNVTEPEQGVAPRHQGALPAMEAAYRSGQVFIGELTLPVLDVRHYLETDLDMHHVSASFFSRLRIQQATNQADNHVIWVVNKAFDPITSAFKNMNDWLLNKDNPQNTSLKATLEAKPTGLKDACFDQEGKAIAAGTKVWDGDWNEKTAGVCSEAFPMYSTSRIQAGGQWQGDFFKCQLISVEAAIGRGYYGDSQPQAYIEELNKIFPNGVCDHDAADLGRPQDI